ncbi:ABC transporter ATP-binding protein [Tenuibacillus multivorans]|uniref:ABC-2 type transport system ATP-binding protein n=1 Tax=Tenuibacillus multivorans TaxID=237069 RepID=A0A1G9W9U0_9BACI|nr:ABC transporter ATP-binding protein [Tenuibacillus multivorans]GEL76365.1 multidrug ABC transporter ATP-binding protein [Tenuibacillus multivorans]SDM81219.1 ABC-2 type transport system ATP-binding protein [Tenuibacillus multivorans]
MILDVNGVTKVFPGQKKSKTVVNDDLTFSIEEGEIFGLLGHNGAGKTTLVNQILGLLTPDNGEINLLGESVIQSPAKARSICSVQPQSQVPLGNLTPKQAVTLMGKMRAGNKFDPKRVDILFEALDMVEWANTMGERLSGGVRRLTNFCMAVIAPGQLVILDEPTNDVDPVRRRYLWQVIRDLTNDGTSVILVTHNVMEAEKAVDRVAIMHQGKFLAQGTPSDVKSSVSNLMRIELLLVKESVDMEIPSWALSTYMNGSRLVFSINPATVLSTIEWAKAQMDQGFVIDYSLSPTTIEDAFIALTSKKEVV